MVATAITPAAIQKRLYHIHTKALYDPFTQSLIPNCVISVNRNTGVVADVWQSDRDPSLSITGLQPVSRLEEDAEVTVVDLEHLTILPGFVDVHVHCMLYLVSRPTVGWMLS